MKRVLWGDGQSGDDEVHAYTAGEDRQWDDELILWDIYGSMAHTKGLERIGLLQPREASLILSALADALAHVETGSLKLEPTDEDCHSALERFLISQCGELGKRIHAGRSRNDQVLVALRLWLKRELFCVRQLVGDLADALLAFAHEHKNVLLPGFTHQRRAMPSTVGLWSAGFAEALIDDLVVLDAASRLVDRCPAGSAAGYGVPLRLDRPYVAELLGFSTLQHAVTSVQLSRGKLEAQVIQALWSVAQDLGRLSSDVILYASEDYGYFELPTDLATGSSIMPHKKNPDVFELTRGRCAMIEGWALQAMSLCSKLPSGYQRDLQLAKEPLFRSLQTTHGMLQITTRGVRSLGVDAEASEEAISGDLLATDVVYELVTQGVPFRSAYRQIAEDLASDSCDFPAVDRERILERRTHAGGAGNLGLDVLEKRLSEHTCKLSLERKSWMSTLARLQET